MGVVGKGAAGLASFNCSVMCRSLQVWTRIEFRQQQHEHEDVVIQSAISSFTGVDHKRRLSFFMPLPLVTILEAEFPVS